MKDQNGVTRGDTCPHSIEFKPVDCAAMENDDAALSGHTPNNSYYHIA